MHCDPGIPLSMNKPLLHWLMLIACLSETAVAHEVKPALLNLSNQDDQSWLVLFKQPLINNQFLNLQLESNCDFVLSNTIATTTTKQESFRLDCPQSPLEYVAIEGLDSTLIDVMVQIETPGQSTEHQLLSASNPILDLSKDRLAVPVYFQLGVEHLLLGIDHVLFVILLLFLIQGWKTLITVITSFTRAHSITLGLSSLNYFSLPQGPIEALIALSIVLLAREVLLPSQSVLKKHPWLVSFLFGLLHGFGFAGALTEIGLPDDAAMLALLLFNLGIEVGQLIIVIMAIAVITVSGRFSLQVNKHLLNLPVLAAGGIAFIWFSERAMLIFTS